ncbi:hypothetical protein WOC76_03680 [Methylocystis sp. IM3]|uniref:hypothetical protein n=1 Tax=unclassified Methylocystis TaxID=2625913 RepID=UPI0030F61FED
MSREPLPTAKDAALVREIAGAFSISRDVRQKVLSYWHPRNYLRWRLKDQKLKLHRRDPATLVAAEFLMHFEREDWSDGLPTPKNFRLVAERREATFDDIQVFDLSAFKGLEADTIILVIGGHLPMRPEETYVGFSRARFALAVVECGANLDLPAELIDTAMASENI